MLTFCSTLFIPFEFSLWKKNFWHGPGISSGPTLENKLFDCLLIIFASCWNWWTMSDTINIFNLFLEPFLTSWLQLKNPDQIVKTRNKHFKNLIWMSFLPKFLTQILQNIVINRIGTKTILKSLISSFFTKIFVSSLLLSLL